MQVKGMYMAAMGVEQRSHIFKQEAYGPDHSPQQFKSINKHMIIKMLIKRRKLRYLLYENFMFLHLNKLESPSPKDAFCQVWLKLAQWFWRRSLFNFVNIFSLFRNHLPLENDWALHLTKFESPSPNVALC